MASFESQNKPKVAGGTEGEVVTPQASLSPLKAFAERIRAKVKEAENIYVNENAGEITMWVGDYFVVLEPQIEDEDLVYTTIQIEEWYYGKVSSRFYISTDKIVYENYISSGYEKFEYTCDFGPNTEDPIYLIDEEELFKFLNSLSEEEFDFKEEFKSFAGLQP